MRDWRRVVGLVLAPFLMVLMISPPQGIAADPFEAVRKLSDSGRHRDAAIAVSKILNSGTLSPTDTARGFYLRGASYAKSNKHPQAISDLTNAIWLSGLSKNERAEAYRLRATAYQATGNQSKAAADLRRAGNPDVDLAQGLSTTVNRTPATQRQTLPTNVASAPATSGWNVQTAGASSSQPAPKPAAPTSSGGNAVSNFFSGIFGGGSGSTAGASTTTSTSSAFKRDDAITVASHSPGRAATSQPVQQKPRQAAASGWSSQVASSTTNTRTTAPKRTQAVPASWNTAVASPPAQKQRVVTAPTTTVTRAAPAGRYNVQITTVREKAAAEAIRQKIAAADRDVLAGRTPRIDTAVLGNMGTFYRVRVDGLPSRDASSKLCQKMNARGHDCFLITR